MKITEIYVERLKSYGDYSNRRVGLRAVLEEGENVKEAYLKLAGECESLLELQEIRTRKELIEMEMKQYQERLEDLKKVKEEYVKIREELMNELNKLVEEIGKIEKLAEEKQLKLSEKIIERLRAIRRALGYFYDY